MGRLIEILKSIEKQPGMYFHGGGERGRSIHNLQAFIVGFQTGQEGADSSRDFHGFTEWVATHYHVLAEGRDSFTMIIEHVGGDEGNAFDEFFRLLPDYLRDRQQMGFDGIASQFCEVQNECSAALRKAGKKQHG